MLCTPRKENVSKLEITLARFTTQNQLPSFHLRTHIAWMKSQSSTKQRNGVLSCLDPNNKSRVYEKDFDGVLPDNELPCSSHVP